MFRLRAKRAKRAPAPNQLNSLFYDVKFQFRSGKFRKDKTLFYNAIFFPSFSLKWPNCKSFFGSLDSDCAKNKSEVFFLRSKLSKRVTCSLREVKFFSRVTKRVRLSRDNSRHPPNLRRNRFLKGGWMRSRQDCVPGHDSCVRYKKKKEVVKHNLIISEIFYFVSYILGYYDYSILV